MKARDGSTGNGHEQKREQLSFDDGAASMNKRREVGKLDIRMNHENAHDQNGDGAQLDIGREIIARLRAAARPAAPKRPDRRWPSGS